MLAQTTVVIATLAILSGTPHGTSDRTSKMYDLRDLATVLPGDAGGAGGAGDRTPGGAHRLFAETFGSAVDSDGTPHTMPILSGVPLLEAYFRSRSAFPQPASDDANSSPTDRLVGKLANLLSLMPEELVENVYFIDGDDESHQRFADAIEKMKALHQDRVQVEVSCYEVAASEAPGIGEESKPADKPTVGGTTVGPRHSLARIEATRSVSYIADWSPVVGDAAVGFDPTIGSVTDGAAFGVRVGAGKEKIRVGVQGVVAKAEISTVRTQSEQTMGAGQVALSPGGALVAIGLPHVERRVIDTDVAISLNRATVVATAPGFSEGTRLVVAVTVKLAE